LYNPALTVNTAFRIWRVAMPDFDRLRRLAEEKRRAEEEERLKYRENQRREEERKHQEQLKSDEERYRRTLSNIEQRMEQAARDGKYEAAILNIGKGGVENFQRIKRHWWSGGYEDHNVNLSQVKDPVARRVFEYCRREGLNPQIRWNPNNHSGSRDYDEDDLFQLFVRW
jgi:hypothetical protein